MRTLLMAALMVASSSACATPPAAKSEPKAKAVAAQEGTKEKLDALKLVKRVEEQQLGNTFRGKLHMTITRPDSKRELDILSWTENRSKSVVKIINPIKDRGTGNLRKQFDLWQYLPKVERTIKIPPSLMLQSWMGSDFTNDDLVKTSSFVRDYTHEFVGYETLDGKKVAKIICKPKPNAPVVWGKLEMWIEPNDAVILKEEFFSEQGEVIKRLTGSNIKKFGNHTIPARLEMTTVKKNTSTVLEYVEATFDEPHKKDVFNEAFLKSPITAL